MPNQVESTGVLDEAVEALAKRKYTRQCDLMGHPYVWGEETVAHREIWRRKARADIDLVAPAIRSRFVGELVDVFAEGGDDLCPPLRETLDAIANQEHQRVREALDKAIFDCGLAAHEGSRSHNGTTELHEAEREALERFRKRLDSPEANR